MLLTKLHAPRRRAGLVDRSRLVDRFPSGALPRLLLVSAPAGFGKSTLLAEWFAGDGGPALAWLSLDPRDNDPAVFWSYVVAALRDAVPGLDVASSEFPAATSEREALVASLVGQLHGVAHDVVLVLDDYHVIEHQEVHETVSFLVEHLPSHVCVAISTRVDPPLPLARLRASGDLVERRAADLRFTSDEAADYLNETMGLALAATEVATLEHRTEGWIAALQLAALSMRGRDDVAAFISTFAGDDRFVVDYLVEEVLDRQSSDDREFLLATSILGRLSGPLCDALTDRTDGRATLERLDRANLLLVALDDRREWYRYHHLFADVLRAHLMQEFPDRVADLHRRAAGWFASHDDHVDAVTHALASGDVELAADLVEATALTMLRVRQETAVRAWVDALPYEVIERRPVLAIVTVGSRMSTGVTTGVAELLTAVDARLADGEASRDERNAELPEQVAVYRSALALLAGDLDEATRHAERALELSAADDHLRHGSATALIGLSRWRVGDIAAARDGYEQAVAHLRAAQHFADALGCLVTLADLCAAQGRLGDAAAALTSGLDLVRDHPGLRGAADMHAGLSELHLERGDVVRAREHLDASRALGEHAGLPQHAYRWRVASARLLEADGDLAGALDLLAEAERVYDTDFSPPVRPVDALRARVMVASGDLDGASRWSVDRQLSADDRLDYLREFEHATLGRLLVAQQRRDGGDRGAAGLFARLAEAAADGGRVGARIDALVGLASAHLVAGDRVAAVAALDEARALAAPEGYSRVFAEHGAPIVELLGTSVPAAARPATGLVDELSARELDVLRLLRSDLSGPEIARELIVSLNTMRTHTKNIYAKLGVSGRRAAVRRADELGL